jgi:translation initiation factor 2 subunit 2
MEEYSKLLNEAYKKIKPITTSGERFEIPKIEGHLEGNKTILTNLQQTSTYLRRDISHLLKFLLKELATSGALKGNLVILQRKISSSKINEKIQEYVTEFVICKECQKPDTELIKEGPYMFIKCLACGAKHSVRSKV